MWSQGFFSFLFFSSACLQNNFLIPFSVSGVLCVAYWCEEPFPLSPRICIRIMAEFRKIQHNAELMVAPFLIHTGYKILASHKTNILTMCVFTAIARANKQQITCTMYDLKHGGKLKHCQKVTPYSPLWLRVQTEAGLSGTKNTDLIWHLMVMKPYDYKCVSPTITVCVRSLLFKQGQSRLWEAALLLVVSSATFVFQAELFLWFPLKILFQIMCIKRKKTRIKIISFGTLYPSPADLGLLRKLSDIEGLYGYSSAAAAIQSGQQSMMRSLQRPLSATGVLKIIKWW